MRTRYRPPLDAKGGLLCFQSDSRHWLDAKSSKVRGHLAGTARPIAGRDVFQAPDIPDKSSANPTISLREIRPRFGSLITC